MTPEQLQQLARWWRRHLLGREALAIAAVVLTAAAVALVWIEWRVVGTLALGSFIAGCVARLILAPAWKLDVVQLARHLDRVFPELEESSALFLQRPETLTAAERLQRARAIRAAQGRQQATGGIHFAAPRGLLRAPLASVSAALALLVAVIVWQFSKPPQPVITPGNVVALDETGAQPSRTQPQPTPIITRAEMHVAPPAYTGRGERRISGLTAEIEEGATVSWSLAFDQVVDQPRLVVGGRETVPLRVEGDNLSASLVVSETALYHVAGVLRDGTEWKSAELHSLKVLKDQAPTLRILQPSAARTVIDPPASQTTVEVLASDDYGIAAAHLVATVAKGTGEAVKFREQQITFDRAEPAPDAANGRRLTKVLDLAALGLEPGDELYFHVAARDYREPAGNQSRSETRFIVLRGPEQHVSTRGTGVAALNVLPQYFRSQRQIIIDTEKLIGERAQLTAQEFSRRANDLGIDQQMLRQRYGQFLGQEEHFEGDGHDHSAGLMSEMRTQEQVVERFGHQHDSEDEATVFQGEAKATMRGALAAMWEAEGLLRTGRAEEALAPENRALEFLKVLQQADRAYVQRVGFEAAPLNVPERRLRGDASDVPERAVAAIPQGLPDEGARAVRSLLRSARWSAADALSEEELELARRVDAGLTKAATEDPAQFLGALRSFRRTTAGERLTLDEGTELERALLRMLGGANPLPHRAEETAPELADRYFRKTGAAK